MLVAATAALTAGAATSTAGTAASLDVDGGVLQFFRLAGPGPVVVAPLLEGDGVAAATEVLEPLPPQVDGPALAALAQPPVSAAPSTSTAQATPAAQVTPEPTVTPTEPAPTGAAAPATPTSEATPTQVAPSSPPAPEPPAAAPAAAPEPTTEPAAPVYEDCAAFREDRDPELEPLTADDPAYRVELDADGDGSACTDADLAAEAAAAPDRQPPPAG